MSQHRSSHYRSEVVRYVPWRRYFGWGMSGFLVLLVVLLSYYLGGVSGRQWRTSLEKTNIDQREKIEALEHELSMIKRQLTSHELSVELGRRASEELRQSIVALQQINADLEEQITFYKGLMDPSMNGNVSFRGVEVQEGLNAGEFAISAIVQQLSLNHSVVKGTLHWRLAGMETSDDGSIRERDLEGAFFGSGGAIKLRFKYFQNVADTVTLPEGFTPKVLHLSVAVSGNKNVEAVGEYPWASLIEG